MDLKRNVLALAYGLKPLRRLAGKLTKSLGFSVDNLFIENYLVSFPKCGRTWLRMMLGMALADHFKVEIDDPTDLRRLSYRNPAIPFLHATHDLDPQKRSAGEISSSAEKYAGKRVIFLVRDPRDVLVSLYFHNTFRRNMETDLPLPENIGEMITMERGGLKSLIAFYNMWAANTESFRSILLVRYEDLSENPGGELRRVLDFLGVSSVSEETIRRAVEGASFDNMRRIESSQSSATNRLRPAIEGEEGSYKTRRGVVGGYRDDFSVDEIAQMNAIIESELSDYYAPYKQAS